LEYLVHRLVIVCSLAPLLYLVPACDCNDGTTPPPDGDLGVADKGPPTDAESDAKGSAKPGITGRHSALAASGGTLYASAYENTYGDLVLLSAKVTDLKTITYEVVDGVPSVTPPEPGTYRGGITTAGDDVGYHTDIFASPTGELLISYHDRGNRSLKVATRAGGKWATHTVAEPADDKQVVGRYTALAIVDNKPVIAFLVINIAGQGGTFTSEVRAASAEKTLPAAADDWTITTVDSQAMPCQNLCASDEACIVKTNGSSACEKTDTGCDPKCASGEACVGGACKTALADLQHTDLPTAAGLWPCIVDAGGKPVVLYYDRVNGNLKGAIQSGASWTLAVVKGNDSDDVGAFCSATVTQGGIHAAYQDVGKLALNYVELDPATLKPKLTEVIDDGLRADGPHPVGADSAIVVDASGKVRVIYQDAQSADLLAVVRSGANSWTPLDKQDKDLGRLLKGGPRGYGFYSDLVSEGGKLYGSTFYFDQATTPKGGLEFFTVP
jgi:hypothetical protein